MEDDNDIGNIAADVFGSPSAKRPRNASPTKGHDHKRLKSVTTVVAVHSEILTGPVAASNDQLLGHSLYRRVGPVSEQRTILKCLQDRVAQAIAVKDEMMAACNTLLKALHVYEVTGTSTLNNIHSTDDRPSSRDFGLVVKEEELYDNLERMSVDDARRAMKGATLLHCLVASDGLRVDLRNIVVPLEKLPGPPPAASIDLNTLDLDDMAEAELHCMACLHKVSSQVLDSISRVDARVGVIQRWIRDQTALLDQLPSDLLSEWKAACHDVEKKKAVLHRQFDLVLSDDETHLERSEYLKGLRAIRIMCIDGFVQEFKLWVEKFVDDLKKVKLHTKHKSL